MGLAHRRWALTLALAPALAFGWGAGHDSVARAVAGRLPEPWRSRLQGEALKRFCADSHYPDSFEPFPVERVGDAAWAYLAANGLAKRYDLHSDKGRAAAFCLLVRSIKEARPERALLWLAALSHATADMAACNHDPVVHVATYGWCQKEWSLKLPAGRGVPDVASCLDLGWVKEDVFARFLDNARVSDGGGGAEEALLEIMLYGVRGVDACAPHGPLVLSAAAEWVDTGRREAGERLASELSSLGAWAAGRSLRDFQVALRLASADVTPDLTAGLLARYETEMDTFVTTRPLSDDLIVREALTPCAAKGPKIGVAVEPCWRMNEGLFGFGDRVLAVQIVSALRRTGRNAELVDVRTLIEQGSDARVLIVPAQRCAAYRTLKADALEKRLAGHLGAGGKVVWIGGGKPPAALCHGLPKDVLIKGEDKAWPVPLAVFTNGTLKVGSGARPGGAFTCVNAPQGPAGWQWPQNPYVFAEAALSCGHNLVGWSDGSGRARVVGLVWPKEVPAAAYVPGYAVMPYVWTREAPSLYPLRLELDAAGIAVLESALGWLM